jgi:hypothetical protein
MHWRRHAHDNPGSRQGPSDPHRAGLLQPEAAPERDGHVCASQRSSHDIDVAGSLRTAAIGQGQPCRTSAELALTPASTIAPLRRRECARGRVRPDDRLPRKASADVRREVPLGELRVWSPTSLRAAIPGQPRSSSSPARPKPPPTVRPQGECDCQRHARFRREDFRIAPAQRRPAKTATCCRWSSVSSYALQRITGYGRPARASQPSVSAIGLALRNWRSAAQLPLLLRVSPVALPRADPASDPPSARRTVLPPILLRDRPTLRRLAPAWRGGQT